jgi:adenylate cyclase
VRFLQPADLARSKSFIPPAFSATKQPFEKNRVAVLPLQNLSPDPNDEYFADGLTEELIDRLSQVRGLEVIARTSVMSYKKKEKKIAEIARELSVGSLVEGSVRKAGNRIRVTAQLINAATEAHLWSSHYDKNLEDIFAVQTEIAEKVAVELKTKLLDSEKQTLEKKPTENTEAYSNFLRGRELLREGSEASLKQAGALFEKAIQLDSSFARAYVGAAECHQWLSNVGKEPFDESHSTARQLLERALDLDPNLPEAHAVLSAILFDEDDALGSEAEANKALELNPSLPEPYWMLFELAGLKGDPREMVRQMETAYRLDPIRPHYIWLVGLAYLFSGREQEALEHWKKNEQLAPAWTSRGMTEYYLAKGDLEKAKEFQEKAEKLDPTNPRVIYMGGILAAMQGDREKALLAIKKVEDLNLGPVGFNYVGFVYHALGDLNSSFAYMNKALEAHAIISMVVMYSPLLAKARTDPRYTDLLEKLRKQTGLS